MTSPKFTIAGVEAARLLKLSALAAVMALTCGPAFADNFDNIKPGYLSKKPKMLVIPGDLSLDTNGAAPPVANAGSPYLLGFEGVSQYDGASFGRNFIPPDTMGAVGKTQFFESTNGAYAVFDKKTGARLSLVSDNAFWAAAGQPLGTNGDTRVMYNADAQRWIVVAFGSNTKDLQIAISNTSDALGGWKSTKFEGYAGLGFGATADYPTLALDKNAVYIGTNDFAPARAGGPNRFRGTTLDVIPIESLFNGVAPTTTNMKQFVTTLTAVSEDRGFAIQGVNSRAAGSQGTAVANSLFFNDNVAYKINGLSTSSALGSSQGGVVQLGLAPFRDAGPARQPDVVPDANPNVDFPNNKRVVDALDQRISSSVYEARGRLYTVQTVNPLTGAAGDFARVHYTVLDATSFAILDEGDIGTGAYDYYQGSIAVNKDGVMVVGYNRSGLDPLTGKISFMARSFLTTDDGRLQALSDEILLHESLVDDYHNGSVFGQVAVGRQRWGDYAQVTIDPDDDSSFFLIGEFAREYNNAAGGHPGGTGGSRWGTWIAQFAAVPEPGTLLMVLLGFAAAGVASRRRVTH